METRLGVATSTRFPLFRPLIWHAAAHYDAALRNRGGEGLNGRRAAEGAPRVSAWELSGLTAVLAFLKRAAGGKGRAPGGVASCPASIPDPPGEQEVLCASSATIARLPVHSGATPALLFSRQGGRSAACSKIMIQGRIADCP